MSFGDDSGKVLALCHGTAMILTNGVASWSPIEAAAA
jgi:hypothetical protein